MQKGSNVGGSSRSKRYSVFGKSPRSLSKKNDTLPTAVKFLRSSAGMDASSAASLIAVSFIPKPTVTPPETLRLKLDF